jgi:hypothetical protein
MPLLNAGVLDMLRGIDLLWGYQVNGGCCHEAMFEDTATKRCQLSMPQRAPDSKHQRMTSGR